MKEKLAVVAFGGNALLRGNEAGTIEDQEKNTYDTCIKVLELIKQGYNILSLTAMVLRSEIFFFGMKPDIISSKFRKCLLIFA